MELGLIDYHVILLIVFEKHFTRLFLKYQTKDSIRMILLKRMKLLQSLLLLTSLCIFKVLSEELDVTVTQTRYVTVECLQAQALSILSGNPTSQSTGIPIVFVYNTDTQNGLNDKSNTKWSDSTESNIIPLTLITKTAEGSVSTSTAKISTIRHIGLSYLSRNSKGSQYQSGTSHGKVATGTNTDEVSRTSEHKLKTTTHKENSFISTSTASSIGNADINSANTDNSLESLDTAISAGRNIKDLTADASTSKKTIFKATITPKSSASFASSKNQITSTQKNPLVTESAISLSLEVSIDISKYSKNQTFLTSGNAKPTSTRDRSTFKNSSSYTSISDDQALASLTSKISSDSDITSASLKSMITGSSKINRSLFKHWNSSTTIEGIASYGKSTSQQLTSILLLSNLTSTMATDILNTSSTYSIPSSLSSNEEVSSKSFSERASSTLSSEETSSTPSQVAVGSSLYYTGNLFEAISQEKPSEVFGRSLLPLALPSGADNAGVPYQTNKFHTNLILSSQTDPIYVNPYVMFWKKTDYYGFGVYHVNKSMRVFGSTNTNNEDVASYYFNPVGNAEFIFSSPSLSSDKNYLTLSEMEMMSINAKLSAEESYGNNYIEVPIVQGMGFSTAIYHGDMKVLLNSLVGVSLLEEETSSLLPQNVQKYRATLFNGVNWLIYVTMPNDKKDFKLSAKDPYNIVGSSAMDGLVIQLSFTDDDSSQKYYDVAAGMYTTSASLEGSVSDGTVADYSFTYKTSGESVSGNTIIFALPHHLDTLTSDLLANATGISITSSSKGDMQGFLANSLTFSESLDTVNDIYFLPWTRSLKGTLEYTSDQLQQIAKAANKELSVDIKETVNSMNSNYFSGKVIDKYAYILLVVSEILKDDAVTNATLSSLKEAFQTFTNNKQYYPLMYDTVYGGVTSTASQNGDTGADYGSAYYNDHHFHYGYFVHAAAVVGFVDKKLGGTWAEDNKDWINSLIRDVANPTKDDAYFPVSRMFDWYGGHSWAGGLFTSGDGRNEESSSEDYNFAYGMKLWGNIMGDGSMESRADLMLTIMARSMNQYFYYKSDNKVEPSEILPNKVSGIIFDNKIAYTTYFGAPDEYPEYVHGIHMLPVTPVSSLIRIPSYVEEEWDDQISTFIDDVESGWTGILRLNQALYDPSSSYDFFSSADFSDTYLDNGQSRTWALAFSAGIANSS